MDPFLLFFLGLMVAVIIGSYYHAHNASFKPKFIVLSDNSVQMEFRIFGGLRTKHTERFYAQYKTGMEIAYQNKKYQITQFREIAGSSNMRPKIIAYLEEINMEEINLEKAQVSTHDLKSDYSIKGKLKNLLISWSIFLIFLAITRIPAINNLLAQSRGFASWVGKYWYIIAVLIIVSTIAALIKKHPFSKVNIYSTGIGFVDKKGLEKYLDYGNIKLSYGVQESVIIELFENKKTSYTYAWKEFTQPDVLKNNLERYSTIK